MERDGFAEQEVTRMACKDVEQMEVVFAELFSRETSHQQEDYTKTMESRSDDAHSVGRSSQLRSNLILTSIAFPPI